MGEVWCVTLWDARRNVINRLGYGIGNQLVLQIVTDGMKLCPANPTFIQARDAIIQAVQVNNYCATNWDDFWAAFSKRGLGGGATGPSVTLTSPVYQSFGPPPTKPCQE